MLPIEMLIIRANLRWLAVSIPEFSVFDSYLPFETFRTSYVERRLRKRNDVRTVTEKVDSSAAADELTIRTYHLMNARINFRVMAEDKDVEKLS
jgi:hypothetical protein